MPSNTDLFRSARDHLVDVMADYRKAVDTFEWPPINGAFNWATDWFDAIARATTGSRCGSSRRTAASRR